MLSELDQALEATGRILAALDRIIAKLCAISDRQERSERLARLNAFLSPVMVGRTLNMGWLTYARAVCGYWDSLSPGEPEVMADQIRKNMAALVAAISAFQNEPGFFESEKSLRTLRRIAEGKDDLVRQVRTARDSDDQASIDRIALEYEKFCKAIRVRAKDVAARLATSA